MKKAFIIVLMVCLTFGMAFAAKKADVKVGAQVGYGNRTAKLTFPDVDDTYMKISNGGFLFAVNGEYGITEEISIKAEVGVNTLSKANMTTHTPYYTNSMKDESNAGVLFEMYVGGQYAFEINKEISVKVGAGLDMAAGKHNSGEDSKNTSIGLGLEVVGSYAIDKNISALVGGKFGWHFINSNETLKSNDDQKCSTTAFQIFAGATYAL